MVVYLKGNNLRDLHFASPDDKAFPKRVPLLKEANCHLRENVFL